MLEVETTGQYGLMATRSGQNVLEAENVSIVKAMRDRAVVTNIICRGRRYRLTTGKDRNGHWPGISFRRHLGDIVCYISRES